MDRTASINRADGIIASIRASWEAGTLTKETFQDAWRELEGLLKGDEVDLLESLALWAYPGWVEEVDPSEDDEPLVEYFG